MATNFEHNDLSGPGPLTVAATWKVKPGKESEFEEWHRGISAAAIAFPGHLGVNVMRPGNSSGEYVVIFKCDTYEHLASWQESEVRREWLQKAIQFKAEETRYQTGYGIEFWFTSPREPVPPPRWKMAVVTMLAIGQTMIPIYADTVLFNGRIATLDPVTPEVRAVAIRYGRFIAVGDDKDIQAYRGPSTKVIDLKGRTVIPGLNDSHIHVIRGGLNYNMELRWDGVSSLSIALRMLKEQALRTPAPQWVRVVGGWSEFQFVERRLRNQGDTLPRLPHSGQEGLLLLLALMSITSASEPFTV